MTLELDGKQFVITGAIGGLGISVVHALLGHGATCHLPSLTPDVPDSLPFAGHERVHFTCSMDLAVEPAVEAFYAALPQLWASIHLAGGFAMAPAVATSLHDFDRMFTMNARTCFLCCREAVKAMRKHGQGGRIVNVAARPALVPAPGMLAYTASKAAVAAMTQALAVECKDEGILVNAIVPSIIDTPGNRRAMPDADFSAWPKPEDIAETIRFLASPVNRLTSGCLVPVYGRA